VKKRKQGSENRDADQDGSGGRQVGRLESWAAGDTPSSVNQKKSAVPLTGTALFSSLADRSCDRFRAGQSLRGRIL